MAELDEDLLRLHADQIDLVDGRYPQQALPDVLGEPLELGKAHTISGHHVERRIDVAKLVVEIRAGDIGGQIGS